MSEDKKDNQNPQSTSSRVLKFRAWNKEKKIMVYDNEDESAHYFDGVYGTDLGIINNRLEDFFDRYDYMQYTGLKDKNGKEIYEGDIIGVPYIAPSGVIYEGYDEEKIRPVIYENGGFALRKRYESEQLINYIPRKEGKYIENYGNLTIMGSNIIGEVIGNIYENHDML